MKIINQYKHKNSIMKLISLATFLLLTSSVDDTNAVQIHSKHHAAHSLKMHKKHHEKEKDVKGA